MEVVRTTDLYNLFECNIKGPVPQEAIRHLVKWGLIPEEGKYMCPNGHLLQLKPENNVDGWVWRCRGKIEGNKKKTRECLIRISFRKGTFFDKSHLSIYQILEFSLMWCKNVPLNVIMEDANIESVHTGVDWNNFCREVVVSSSFQSSNLIGGPGVVVEIDESKIGKRKYHRGHFVEGQWVFGAVERKSGRCCMVPVEDRTRETLMAIIKRNILPGSIIVSDCWKSYQGLSNEGYTHFTVNHSKNFKDPTTGQHTNTIEGLWRHLKISLPVFNRRKIYFNGYIQKFIFLRRCKANGTNRFAEFCRYAGYLYDPMKLPGVEQVRYEEDPIDLFFVEDENAEIDDVNANDINPLG